MLSGGWPRPLKQSADGRSTWQPAKTVTFAVDRDDDAAKKLIYLALRGVAAKWKRPPQFNASRRALQPGEFATLEWAHLLNHRRILTLIGDRPRSKRRTIIKRSTRRWPCASNE